MALHLLIQFLLYLLGVYAEPCFVNNCDYNSYNNNTCTKCDASYFLISKNECSQCYVSCRECDGELCYFCAHSSCDSCMNNCTCSSNLVFCSTCPNGYYMAGSKCYKCHFPGCTCLSKYDCTECLPGFYGTSNKCRNRCLSNCLKCKQASECTECIHGKYGQQCQSNCSTVCDDGTCDESAGVCVNGCATGQYLDQRSICKKCPQRCSACTDFHNCSSCKMSYYWGNVCRYDCIGNYKKCDQDHGCIFGCKSSYYNSYDEVQRGYTCRRCPENCLTCSNSTLCSTCKAGHWGRLCEYTCTERCKVASGLQTCGKSNGTCIYGCQPGYWGHFCDLLCEMGCDESVCNLTTGVCVKGCRNHLFGNHCNKECSSNCIHDTQTYRHCDESSGNCPYGCNIGWYGDNCTRKCNSSCKELLCYQQNGLCLLGFSDDFTASSNTTELSSVDVESNASKTVIVALSIITGIAIVVASLSAGVIIILFKRGGFKLISRNGKSALKGRQDVGESREENNQYEGLNRRYPTDEAYSTIANEYENHL